jgi:predicted nucleic acid-binding Zn ribbon protein
MLKMVDGKKQLKNMVRWRSKRKLNREAQLGAVVRQLIDNKISPQQARFGILEEVWNELLPAELCRHCEITGISGGQLKVLVDSPSYVYELQLCRSELLEAIQMQCPRANIKKIKFTIG